MHVQTKICQGWVFIKIQLLFDLTYKIIDKDNKHTYKIIYVDISVERTINFIIPDTQKLTYHFRNYFETIK